MLQAAGAPPVFIPDEAAHAGVPATGGRPSLAAGTELHSKETARPVRGEQDPRSPALAHHEGTH